MAFGLRQEKKSADSRASYSWSRILYRLLCRIGADHVIGVYQSDRTDRMDGWRLYLGTSMARVMAV
jgi:hypothetical protein